MTGEGRIDIVTNRNDFLQMIILVQLKSLYDF